MKTESETHMEFKKRVIALGFFDGIHLGHSALMQKAAQIGEEQCLVASVITFDTPPHNLIHNTKIGLINSLEDRAGLINRKFGIFDILFLHFDKETASIPWDGFIDYLVEDFGARHLVAGNDFRFGYKGLGNSTLLVEKCADIGVGCDIIAEVTLDGIKCSSTYIRELLVAGEIERANAFLGHAHVLTDVVRYGYRLGRSLGTPTINMRFDDDVLIPAHGVYATKVYLQDGSEHIGVTNIGIRPTVDTVDGNVNVETHILNFRGNLYGHKVRLEFYTRLRPEIKFSNTEELKNQIRQDCDAVSTYFA